MYTTKQHTFSKRHDDKKYEPGEVLSHFLTYLLENEYSEIYLLSLQHRN